MTPRIAVYTMLLLFSFLLQSCAVQNKPTEKNTDQSNFREELLDTLFITDANVEKDNTPKEYRASAKLTYDLLHTKLDVRFDWQKQNVLGKAFLTLSPYFYPIEEVILDAVNFDIHEIKLLSDTIKPAYEYTGEQIKIFLPRKYTKGEKIEIYIHYTAKPEESKDHNGDAIASDKGLFFINPEGKDKNKPKQIWTQGETENNKKWFPTFDKPNERCTQEIYITVEDNFTTLSNGKLISSTRNADGTRTDYWKQDLPHAPYLFMLAVGEFHEEKEMWKQIPLHYFVEKGFAKHAKKIFNHTPEMLDFFTDKLKYDYPWEKYAQVVVRDFVSGAMENTGAVVFGDFVQKSDRELIDNDNDYIVAHELMHHWFGNLVTMEEWSNLTLNEGFANYAEYLWFEHKYGRERADYHRLTEMNGYFSQAYSSGAHPLIHYYYGNKDDMFDAHSYNKGGLVLHMLRHYVGDEAFYVSLNAYLKKHALTSVEVDELRMAFEDTIGEDLQWFFDQWFMKAGHPSFDVNYTYLEDQKSFVIQVNQTQDSVSFPAVFQMPLEIALYDKEGKVEYHNFFMNKRQQEFIIQGVDEKPTAFVFDGKNTILGLINENKTQEEYVNQYRSSSLLADKIIALSNIEDKSSVIEQMLREKFFYLRSLGVESITEEAYPKYINIIQDMVLFDPHSQVRASALQTVLSGSEEEVVPLLKRVIESEQAYPVLGLALEGLSYFDQEAAQKYAEFNMKDKSPYLVNSLLSVFSGATEEKYLEYFHEKFTEINMYQLFDFFDKYHIYLEGQGRETWQKSAQFMFDSAKDPYEDPYKKFFCMNTLVKLKSLTSVENTVDLRSLKEDIQEKIETLKSNETDPLLKMRYSEIENQKP